MGNKRQERVKGGAQGNGRSGISQEHGGLLSWYAYNTGTNTDPEGQRHNQSKGEDVKMGEGEVNEAKIICSALREAHFGGKGMFTG